MKLVDNVFEISESFMNDPQYVFMDETEIEGMAQLISKTEKPKFPIPYVPNVFKKIVIELVAGSINYCYWYGRSDIRPNGSSSTLMYDLVLKSFNSFTDPDNKEFSDDIDILKKNLALNRLPLLQERCQHLDELKKGALEFCIGIENRYEYGIGLDGELDYFFTQLIELFPGYASDMFLKRASLFFIQLYRNFGWLEEELKTIHVPADYQIPKMLEHFSCLKYSSELKHIIGANQPIPKHSQMECEIRSATVLTMRKLCELTGWNIADIDAFFFLKRKEPKDPFHLTITTDY